MAMSARSRPFQLLCCLLATMAGAQATGPTPVTVAAWVGAGPGNPNATALIQGVNAGHNFDPNWQLYVRRLGVGGMHTTPLRPWDAES